MDDLSDWNNPKVRKKYHHVPPPQPPKEYIKMSQLVEQEAVLKQLDQIATIFKASKGAIRPHFMMTGPSGSGKSFIAEALADKHDLHFLEVNAAQLTKEGTSGNSLSKALAGLSAFGGGQGICFVDEYDKLFISGNTNSQLAHETTNGVQNEFLKLLESKSTQVYGDYGKYHDIPVSNVLFIFAGAFNGEEKIDIDRLRAFGIKTEFIGRVGLIYNLQKISLESMRTALEGSQLLGLYLGLFQNVKKETVIDAVMPHIVRNHEKNTLGIRVINTLLHQFFINGGKLPEIEMKKTAFQTTMELAA